MYKKLPEPGPVALRAAQESLDNVGVTEVGKSNWGKWIKLYLAAVFIFSPAAWCLAFLVFRLKDAAKDLGVDIPKWVPSTGYTPSFASAAKKAGRFTSTADAIVDPLGRIRRGDMVYFYMAKMGRIAHVGVVIQVHTWGVTTVEGNTSADGGGVQRDGGGVHRKSRRWAELGDPEKSGFVRLDF